MRYLFFDIECCDGEHICEFGYVITNDKFKPLKRDVITINPDKPFRLTGRKNQADLTLFFSEKEYYDSPQFPVYYDRIKELIEYHDQIILGHAIGNDAMFLRTACKRYGLSPINFKFVDSQKIYSEFNSDKERISLEKAEAIFNLEKPEYRHKSDEDAYQTVQLVEKMCSTLEMTLQEIMELCPTACGRSHNFNIMYTGNSLSEMLAALEKNVNSLSNNKKQRCIRKFSEEVQPEGEIIKSKLNGTKLCLSTRFEKDNIRETLKLIQLLANHGCQYNVKVSENDYYIASKEEIENTEVEQNTRFYSATHREDGHLVEVLTIDELFKILGITADMLSVIEMPKISKKNRGNKPHGNYYSTGKVSTTIGDVLRSQGVDLVKQP